MVTTQRKVDIIFIWDTAGSGWGHWGDGKITDLDNVMCFMIPIFQKAKAVLEQTEFPGNIT